ncbi:hypothetical protein Taro_022889 [Colocasia esculenta]|uniref:Aminotransferase-like plant mobile domain-containing protein n=1 Tax=Colocasia esculenta TaxID=4460 RepID=A0A843V2S2_COLES|nr:hypothetical protein [Colocasia esculenta]
MRARVSWTLVLAVYLAFTPFQRERVEEMGFGEILGMERMRADPALTQALRSRWDAEATAFAFPWGHMIPSLEDVSRITGLRTYGRPVSGYTYPCYYNLAQRLLELPVERRSSLVPRVPLQESLGLFDVGKVAGESDDEHLDRLTQVSRRELASEPGAQADLDLRRFLVLFLGGLLFAMRGNAVHYRFLPLLEDLGEVGGYAWGAAFLAHQFESMGASERQTSTSGFYPFLQVVWQLYLEEGDEGQPCAHSAFGRVQWSSPPETAFAGRVGVSGDSTTLPIGVDVTGEIVSLRALVYSAVQDREAVQRQTAELRGELERVRSTGSGGASSSRGAGGSPSLLEAQLAGAVLRGEEAQRHLEERLTTEHAMELQGERDRLRGEVQTTWSERDQLCIRAEATEAQVVEATKELATLRMQRPPGDQEEVTRLRAELLAQQTVARSLQQIVTDIGRSRSWSRSGASVSRATGASVGQYLASSSSQRRKEEERRRQGDGSAQSGRGGGEMPPPPDWQEGSGESGGGH